MSIKKSIAVLTVILAVAAGLALASIAAFSVFTAVITGLVWLFGTIIAFNKAAQIGVAEGSKPASKLKDRGDSLLKAIGVMFAAGIMALSIMWLSSRAPAVALALFYSPIFAILVGNVSAFILARAEMTTRYNRATQL